MVDNVLTLCKNVTGYVTGYRLMKRRSSITIRDVAREANVSVATVSRHINKSAPVSEHLATRIQEVMEELDFVPTATARHLATSKENAIGLLLTNMHDNQFFAPLLTGIEDVVREYGYNLLIASRRDEAEADFEVRLGVHNTDGVLVFADSLNDEQIALLHRRQHPMVLIHKTPANGLNIPFVTVENKAATRTLINHLISVHGCRRILLMRGPKKQEDSYWREIGYRAALAEHGIEFDESLALCGYFERAIARDALLSFLANPDHPPFDAIFTGDDEAAIGVYDALSEAGYRIPEDVKVVGFDDSSLAPFLTPSLTTVRAPTEEVGRTAAQQLFSLLEGKFAQPVTIHPTQIIIRRSCGCKENDDS